MNTVKAEKIREMIYSGNGVSRKELIVGSGLNARTVACVLENLRRRGMIRSELDMDSGGAGRKAEKYYPCPEEEFFTASIYLDVKNIICLVSGRDGIEKVRVLEPYNIDYATVNTSVERCVRILERIREKHEVVISAVSLTARDRRPPAFLKLAARLLERLLRIPVYGCYPIEAFAWAEQARFPEKRKITVIHFHFEIEIAVLENGKIQKTGKPFAEGLLHLTVDPLGPPCCCGRSGCLGNLVNEYGLNEEFRERKNLPPSSDMETLRKYYLKGDPIAVEMVRKQEDCVKRAILETMEHFRPDLLTLVLLPQDLLLREMSDLLSGNWIPRKYAGKVEFRIEKSLRLDESCANAALKMALCKEKRARRISSPASGHIKKEQPYLK